MIQNYKIILIVICAEINALFLYSCMVAFCLEDPGH